jgi:nicotinate (nicotinamide) nucleotide adenylyltransferase
VRVAALYDVHGNAPALEAVLADLGDVDAVVFGGDLIWGAWPRECVELARSLGERAHFVRGNMDRSVFECDMPSMHWVRERLTEDEAAWILAWPSTLPLGGTLYCHATPWSDDAVVTPASSDERWAAVLDGVGERCVVVGHTHVQYDIERAGHRVVNPGSVGNPTGRATAHWAIVDGDDVALRETDYDTVGTAARWRETGFERTDFADELLDPGSVDDHIAAVEERTRITGLYGGAFDPPHLGHVAVARAAKRAFGIPRLIVLVSEHPGHKATHLSAQDRLALTRAAFPEDDVRLDAHARTIDLLRAESFDDPLFIVGADEFCDFLSWKEPDAVLELTRLAVATRPGFPRERLERVLRKLEHPERVRFFDIEPNFAASREIRARAEAGKPLDGLVPAPVAELIASRGLYVRGSGLHFEEPREGS